ncbi:flavin monoamine oxidase family protein [Paramaledivibacter caminithermalis]|uniref:Monoamine oxidase n=1 Tax=Paramaledivibacter caminithermalis (strain DSM 15212 / CIP 107654 / DViRD3) TaxID=1121301 RepID=A0A1M6PA47_PARC5|nr:FAD-dependent oxidoreductase [Paramaledivibacter caminithermalis]SHK04778.1 monoamine oxidase [Paramaledivibacter caminithermalis DSM 15212]
MIDDIMPPLVSSEPDFSPPQENNPTRSQRHELLLFSLRKAGRPEDFQNIINLLSPPPDITTIDKPGSFKGVKVGIIGGGLAGLSSAFELRKLGFDITIFDALEDRIGGRVYTYYFDDEKKLYGELGAMRIPVSHETTWHYIDLFNLDTRPFIQYNENAFIYVQGVRVRNDPMGKNVMKYIYPQFNLNYWEKNTPWTELINYGLGTPLSSMPPWIRKEILQIKPVYNPLLLYWTGKGIRQVIQTMGLSQGAINLIGSLSPFAGEFFYNSYYELLQEDYPLDFTFLYEIKNGLVNLPLSIYKSLISEKPKEYKNISHEDLGKVTWKGGTLVTEIHKIQRDNRIILKYKDKHINEFLQESFDYVICAIPFSSLRTVTIDPLFSTNKMQAIKEVNYSASQKTIFLCNKRFWEEGSPSERIIGGGSYTDLPIISIWYPSDHANSDAIDKSSKPGVLLASYNFTLDAIRLGNLRDKRRFKEIKRQVEKVHGLPEGYLNSIVKDYKTVQWDKEKYFYGAFCYFMPEQKKLFSYTMIQPEYNGKIFFAGEHTSATHAWMQGALHSGMRAANQLALCCKKSLK